MRDLIERRVAIEALDCINGTEEVLRSLPSADAVSEKDVREWLLAYYKESFNLMGRYYPYEVISWLVIDISKTLFADVGCEQDG